MDMVVREMHIAYITYLFISSKGLQLNKVSAQKPAKQIEAAVASVALVFYNLQLA